MRPPGGPLHFSLSSFLLLLSHPASAAYDCNHARIGGQSFDLSPLSGPHSVSHVVDHTASRFNTTYTLDICKPLRRSKGGDGKHECPNSTWVCGIERLLEGGDDDDDDGDEKGDGKVGGGKDKSSSGTSRITDVIPIAGDYTMHDGRPLDATLTRLKSSSSHADSKKEGLRLELHGGKWLERKQKAVIEFLCDMDRTGLEGDWSGGAAKDVVRKVEKGDKDRDGDDDEKKEDDWRSLRFVSYGPTTDDSSEDTLRLEWRTRYACEGYKKGKEEDGDGKSGNGNGGGSRNAHWGFFTWFIIM